MYTMVQYLLAPLEAVCYLHLSVVVATAVPLQSNFDETVTRGQHRLGNSNMVIR